MSGAWDRLLGPEAYWLAVYALTRAATWTNDPPSAAGNLLLERLSWLLPLVFIPLAFVVYFVLVPSEARPTRVLGRLALSTLVALNVCSFQMIDGIDYGDSRNSGVLGFWVITLLVGGFAYAISRLTLAVSRRQGWVS